MADIGKRVREYLTDKMGNPVLTSRKKEAIKEIEGPEEKESRLHELQERGEDYPAREHRPVPKKVM